MLWSPCAFSRRMFDAGSTYPNAAIAATRRRNCPHGIRLRQALCEPALLEQTEHFRARLGSMQRFVNSRLLCGTGHVDLRNTRFGIGLASPPVPLGTSTCRTIGIVARRREGCSAGRGRRLKADARTRHRGRCAHRCGLMARSCAANRDQNADGKDSGGTNLTTVTIVKAAIVGAYQTRRSSFDARTVEAAR